MPIPSEHLERLEVELAGHESWLRALRRKIEGLEAEASAHETVLRLGRDPELRRVLDGLHDKPELAERLAEDPQGFFEKQGIEVPDGATVTVTAESAVEARFPNPPWDYGVGWSATEGFYLIPGPDPPREDAAK